VGWVTRGGRRYYSRSYRLEGRTKRQYLGRGPQAEQAAAVVAKARADRTDEAKRLAPWTHFSRSRRMTCSRLTWKFSSVQ
jgi:hypothetical protein